MDEIFNELITSKGLVLLPQGQTLSSGKNVVPVSNIFQWHIPSYHTMDLGSTQPLTKMSTRNVSWG